MFYNIIFRTEPRVQTRMCVKFKTGNVSTTYLKIVGSCYDDVDCVRNSSAFVYT